MNAEKFDLNDVIKTLRITNSSLAKENELLKASLVDTLYFLERHSNRWDEVNGKHPFGVVETARALLGIDINNEQDSTRTRLCADIYKVQREEPCKCHPETCCCGDLGWQVMETDKVYLWASTKQKAERVAKALNQLGGAS